MIFQLYVWTCNPVLSSQSWIKFFQYIFRSRNYSARGDKKAKGMRDTWPFLIRG